MHFTSARVGAIIVSTANDAPLVDGTGYDIIQPGPQNENTKYLSREDIKTIMDTKNQNDISIVYLNIGSLPRHIDELQSFLFSTNCWPTIIALAETAITETVHTDYHPVLPNYTFKDIKSSIAHGSVGVFIKNEVIDDVEICDDLNIWQSTK